MTAPCGLRSTECTPYDPLRVCCDTLKVHSRGDGELCEEICLRESWVAHRENWRGSNSRGVEYAMSLESDRVVGADREGHPRTVYAGGEEC
jgi:hypothetical protein